MIDYTYLYHNSMKNFLTQIKKLTREIIHQETELELRRERICYQGFSYPLRVVIFEHPTNLGYFKSDLYEFGFHKGLINLPTNTLKNIIRHELAHFLCYLQYGCAGLGHSSEFHDTCRQCGWDKNIWAAKIELSIDLSIHVADQTSKILEKVKKLLNLAASSNQHEAEIATIKANNLLLKYNLEQIQDSEHPEDTILKRVLTGKRLSGKDKAIYHILQDFFVYPVFNHFRGGFYLEIIGSKSNVHFAEYVSNFLTFQLDHLWKQAKTENNLNGKREKNSFYQGLAQGFTEKNKIATSNACTNKELIPLNLQLEKHKQQVYTRISQQSSQAKTSPKATGIGRLFGKKLTINPAIKSGARRMFLK